MMGKMWRPRRPAKAPLEAAGVKDTEGIVVEKMCRSQAKAPLEAVGVKDTEGFAVRKMLQPRQPAKEPPEEVGVKDTKGVAVGKMWQSQAKAPLEAVGVKDAEGFAVRKMLQPRQPAKEPPEEVGVKDTKGVAVGKMWRPWRPEKAPLEVVGVKDAEGVAVREMWQPRRPEKAPLEVVSVKDAEGVALRKMLQPWRPTKVPLEAVGVKDTKGVAVGKMWQPRRPEKAPLEVVGVKDTARVAVQKILQPRRLKKAPLEVVGVKDAEGVAVRKMLQLEAVGVKDTKGVAVGKMWQPRRPKKAPLEVVGVKDAEGVAFCKILQSRRPEKAPLEVVGVKDVEGVAVIADDGVVEASVLGVPVVTAAGGGEKGPLEVVIALDGAPIITVDRKGEVSVQGDPVIPTVDRKAEASVLGVLVVAATEEKKGPLEDGIALDGAPIIVTDTKGEVSVQGDPVDPAVDGEVNPCVLGVPVVAASWGREKRPLEDGIDLDGVSVIATDEKGEVSVQGDPVVPAVDGEAKASVLEVLVVAAVGGGEKGPMEDRIALNGAPVIATDGKGEVSVQGHPVISALDEEAIAMKGIGTAEKDAEGIKWLKHYSSTQSILTVGDGDLSFSLALATAFGSGENLVATSLDSYGALTSKYGKAESNVRELKRLGATVLHGIDAKTMKLHSYLEMRQFDRIVFNFPHSGFNGREDHLHVIKAHKQLVHGFFANARNLLRPYGETHLSHKIGFPYDAWDIEQLAYESCFIMVRKVDFSKEDYPGYNQKRGDSATCDQPFALGPCCTFMFCIGDVENLKQVYANWAGSISYLGLGDSKFYPGISATDMWPFDLHPLAPAWPQPNFPPVNRVHMPIAFDPCPSRVAEMEHTVNCYDTCFHHQDMLQPMSVGPPLNVLPSQGGSHPPMMSVSTLAHWEQPWYQEGAPIVPPWRGNYPYSPQEHQSMQREYEIHRQQMLFLEHHYMESVEKQARLEMLIQVYGRH